MTWSNRGLPAHDRGDDPGGGLEFPITEAQSTARTFRLNGERDAVIILGLVLLLLGFLLKIQLLWIIGLILPVVGAVLFIAGSTGRAVGGRRHYWYSQRYAHRLTEPPVVLTVAGGSGIRRGTPKIGCPQR